MKISEVKDLLANNPTSEQILKLKEDERIGVQKLLVSYEKKIAKEVAERERFKELTRYENDYYNQGKIYIAGVDEAGRGPLAGPLVIAAVILPKNVFIAGLNDSKQLSASKRDKLYDEIMDKAIAIQVNIVSIFNIDKLNIYHATQEGMAQVLATMSVKPDLALIDAMPVNVDHIETVSLIHGDALSVSIAAASIIAKVTRDRIMEKIDAVYPGYGFAQNKGYGSSAHMQAINKLGATCWHRRSYEPVKSMHLPTVTFEENILYSPLDINYEYVVKK